MSTKEAQLERARHARNRALLANGEPLPGPEAEQVLREQQRAGQLVEQRARADAEARRKLGPVLPVSPPADSPFDDTPE